VVGGSVIVSVVTGEMAISADLEVEVGSKDLVGQGACGVDDAL
jgi:hypothetical protein